MDRSPGFASNPCDYFARLRLAFAAAPSLRDLTLPHRLTRWLIMQKARRRALSEDHSPSTACEHTVSGTISLPSTGYFSPFPHGTGSLSVVSLYLALGGGPPGFPRGFTCPAVLGCRTRKSLSFRLRGYHPLWPVFPDRLTIIKICNCPVRLQPNLVRSRYPGLTTPVSLT